LIFTSSRARGVQKLATFLLLALATAPAAVAASGFTAPRRVGFSPGDQWEPALATDTHGHIYILYPQYGPVAQCPTCTAPTMVLLVSSDNGTSWEAPR